MKNALILSLFMFVIGCSSLSPLSTYEKSMARATAERWSSGAPGGARGVTFRVNFYQLEEALSSDTLWVNGVPLNTEVNQVGDTTYVSSFFTTEEVEAKTLANAADYQGRLRLLIKEKVHYLDLERFEIVRTEPRL